MAKDIPDIANFFAWEIGMRNQCVSFLGSVQLFTIFHCCFSIHLLPQRVKHGAVEELGGEVVVRLATQSGEAGVQQELQNY